MSTGITTGLNHRVTRRAGFGLAAAALTAGLIPAARGEGGDGGDYGTAADYSVRSYIDDSEDSGGYGASISKKYNDGSVQFVAFEPYGDVLRFRNGRTNYGLWVEVKVYHSADAMGVPYGLLDTDEFQGFEGSEDYNLGTPDGTGNIKEGRWVAIRMIGDGVNEWSPWAYGKA